MKRGRIKKFIFLILYLALTIYFLNYPFGFWEVSETISQADPWIIFLGGIFMLIGVLINFRRKRA